MSKISIRQFNKSQDNRTNDVKSVYRRTALQHRTIRAISQGYVCALIISRKFKCIVCIKCIKYQEEAFLQP